MSFLVDHELKALYEAGVVTGINVPAVTFGKDSPFQAASLDLTIGTISVPASEDVLKRLRLTDYCLLQGGTVVVETAEKLKMPSYLGAFGFPPAKVSRNGLLMTNPGHIDPGYTGVLTFTLVNLGREPLALVKGDPICTLLFYRLATEPSFDYTKRHPEHAALDQQDPAPDPAALDRVSRDFLDVDRRAKQVASDTAKAAELSIKNKGLLVPLAVAVIAGGLAAVNSWCSNGYDTRITRLEDRTDFERRLGDIERQIQPGGLGPRSATSPNPTP